MNALVSSINCMRMTISFSAFDTIQIDSFDNKEKLFISYGQRFGRSSRRIDWRHLKSSGLQTFIEQPITVAVPYQEFHTISGLVHKHKHSIVNRVFLECIHYNTAKAVKVFAHISRSTAEMYLQCPGKTQHDRVPIPVMSLVSSLNVNFPLIMVTVCFRESMPLISGPLKLINAGDTHLDFVVADLKCLRLFFLYK